MEKVNLTVSIESERLDALAYFMSVKDNTTPQKELERAFEEMYEKYVPEDTRNYLKNKMKPASALRPRARRPPPTRTTIPPTPISAANESSQPGEGAGL